MTVPARAKDPKTPAAGSGSGGGSIDGRNWCRQCGGINACHSWCPTKKR